MKNEIEERDVDPAEVRRWNSKTMRALLDYQAADPSPLTKFLWRCAGADEKLLVHCTHGEHVVYAGLGAFVLLTGILASLTGGYALFTVFRPTDGGSVTAALIVAVLFALLWGIIIFNLDRYIVASSGKGDGKESISWQEFKNAIPRLVLAVVIGMVMSAPLELRLFKREIDVELAKKRIAKQAELELRDSLAFAASSRALDSTIASFGSEMDGAHRETVKAYEDMRDEGDGTAGTSRAGTGPRYAAKKQRYEALLAVENELKAKLGHRQDSLQTVRNQLAQRLEESREKNSEIVAEVGGIVDQMQIAHEKGGLMVWVISLLIMLLEIIPVLSKLMYRAGPYDVLQEHLRILIPARLGVSTETHDLLAEGELITRTTELFPMADVVHREASVQLKELAPVAAPSDAPGMPEAAEPEETESTVGAGQ
jgi:hypothetical protein